MSSNSCLRILQTAPIVSAERGREGLASVSATATSVLQESELELADLDLVPVGEPVRLDPAPVHVGPVERAEIVDEQAVAAADEQSVVTADGDVVEEDRGVRRPPDAHPLLVEHEGFAGAAAPRADHQR